MEQVFNFITNPLNLGTETQPSPSLDPLFLRKKRRTRSSEEQEVPDALTPLESKIKNLIISAYSADKSEPSQSRSATSGFPVVPSGTSEFGAAHFDSISSAPVTPTAVGRPNLQGKAEWRSTVSGAHPIHRTSSATSLSHPQPGVGVSLLVKPHHSTLLKENTPTFSDYTGTGQYTFTSTASSRSGTESHNMDSLSIGNGEEPIPSSHAFSASSSDSFPLTFPPVFHPSPPPPNLPPSSNAGEPNKPAALRYPSDTRPPVHAVEEHPYTLSSSPVYSMVYSPGDPSGDLKSQHSASLIKSFHPPSPTPPLSSQMEETLTSTHPLLSTADEIHPNPSKPVENASSSNTQDGAVNDDSLSTPTNPQPSPPPVRRSPPPPPSMPAHLLTPKQVLQQQQKERFDQPLLRSSSSMTVHSSPPLSPTFSLDGAVAPSTSSALLHQAIESPVAGKAMSETSSVKLPGRAVRTVSTDVTPTPTPLPDHSYPGITHSSIHPPGQTPSKQGINAVGSSTVSVLEKEVASLREELQRSNQEKVNLEGQLESVVAECRSTLTDRVNLQTRLAKTEMELKSYQEHPKLHVGIKPLPKPADEGSDLLSEVKRLESTLSQKRREMLVLNKGIEREKERVKQLSRELAEARESSEAKEQQLRDLQSTNTSLRQTVDQKADEAYEMSCRVATLQASLESTESAKTWLHEQLQGAVDNKLKLQEDLRTAKATTIAQSIKMDQLQKENTLFRQQVGDLQNSILQEKAQLVSELEAIEADVVLNEHSYAEMQDNKAQLEQLLKLKTTELERLSSEWAQMEASKLEGEDQLFDAQQSNEMLRSQLNKVERERDNLHSVTQQQKQELRKKDGEILEIRRAKAVLQDRLKQLEASLVSKQGELQGLKDSREIVKHELEAIRQAKASAETELASATQSVSQLQASQEASEEHSQALRVEIRELQASLRKARATIEDLQLELQEKDKELSTRHSSLSSLQAEYEDLQAQHEDLQAQYEDLQAQCKDLQAQFLGCSGQTGQTGRVQEKEHVIQQLLAEKEQADLAITELEKEQDNLISNIQELQVENAHLQGHLELPVGPSMEEFQQAVQDKARLEGEVSSLKVGHQHEMIRAEARTHHLETELKDAKREAKKKECRLQLELENVQQQVEHLRDALARAETGLREVSSGLKEGAHEKEALQSVMAAREEQLHHLEEKAAELEEENEGLKEQLEENMHQLADMKQTSYLEAQQLKHSAAQTERKLKDQIQELMLEKERYKGRLAGVGTTQTCMREHAEALETTLVQKDSALTQLSNETGTLLREKDKEIEELTEDVANLRDQVSSVKTELERALTDALLEKQRADDLNSQLVEKEEVLSERASTSSERELIAARDQVSKLEATHEDLQVELRALKQQLAISQMTCESATRELKEKGGQVSLLQQEIQLVRQEAEQLREEVSLLNSGLYDLCPILRVLCTCIFLTSFLSHSPLYCSSFPLPSPSPFHSSSFPPFCAFFFLLPSFLFFLPYPSLPPSLPLFHSSSSLSLLFVLPFPPPPLSPSLLTILPPSLIPHSAPAAAGTLEADRGALSGRVSVSQEDSS